MASEDCERAAAAAVGVSFQERSARERIAVRIAQSERMPRRLGKRRW